jgi:subtilisin family serine protease
MQEFILLPREGVRAEDTEAVSIMKSLHLASIVHPGRVEELQTAQHPNLRVLDTAQEDGPKLVEMEAADAQIVNRQAGPVRLLAVVTYKLPDPNVPPNLADLGLAAAPAHPAAPTPFTVECVENGTGRQLPGVEVIAAGGGRNRKGITDGTGKIGLVVGGNKVDRLWAFTEAAHWGAYRSDIPIHNGALVTIGIDPVSVPYRDAIVNYYGASKFNPAVGVKVGVIDSGVGPHADLNVVCGENTVVGEQPSQYDDWEGHGTHVAGLIGASGSSPSGVRGLAPNVRIYSYRAFGQNAANSTRNYSILKAMLSAQKHGCDIINISLGGGPVDAALEAAVGDARKCGMLVVVAAGNEYRNDVSYPAAYPGVIAVSALGVVGCFPPGSIPEYHIDRPPHSTANADEFIAGFSNIGPEIAMTAPGVGVISTLPNNGYGVMNGTSQAAPVVTGAAACLLSQNPDLYHRQRNEKRSVMLERLVERACIDRGFGLLYEGFGLPDPRLV